MGIDWVSVSSMLYCVCPQCSTVCVLNALQCVSQCSTVCPQCSTVCPQCSTVCVLNALQCVSSMLYSVCPQCSTVCVFNALQCVSSMLYCVCPQSSTVCVLNALQCQCSTVCVLNALLCVCKPMQQKAPTSAWCDDWDDNSSMEWFLFLTVSVEWVKTRGSVVFVSQYKTWHTEVHSIDKLRWI